VPKFGFHRFPNPDRASAIHFRLALFHTIHRRLPYDLRFRHGVQNFRVLLLATEFRD